MKKLAWLVTGLYLCMCLSGGVLAAAPVGFTETITGMEKLVYGQEKSGSYVERVDALEMAIYGKTSTMPVPDKITRLNKALYDNAEQASILLVLNYSEAQILDRIDAGPIITRLNKLEEKLMGKQDSGAIGARLEKILKTAFTSGTLKVNACVAPAKTLVKIRLLDTLDSDKNRTGDTFSYEVVGNVITDGNLIIPAGSSGVGKIVKAKAAGRFGQHGKLDLGFNTVPAIDGTMVPLYLGDKARAENKHTIAAAGASVVGAAILGPIGLIGGAFIEGKTAVLPAGTEFFVEIQSDTAVWGVGNQAGYNRTEPAVPATQAKPPVASVRVIKQ